MGKYMVSPLSYDSLYHATAFCSERCTSNGLVAIAENSLRIVQVDRLGEIFTSKTVNTRYTPRKLMVHPTTNNLIVLERDHN
jgi:splicing factor 3B subunit 3